MQIKLTKQNYLMLKKAIYSHGNTFHDLITLIQRIAFEY